MKYTPVKKESPFLCLEAIRATLSDNFDAQITLQSVVGIVNDLLRSVGLNNTRVLLVNGPDEFLVKFAIKHIEVENE